MGKIITASIFGTLFLCITLFAQTEKERIAVLNLEAIGISETEGMTLTDRLRNELMRTQSFMILERSKMAEILEEQGFQMTGCTTTECAVEAGRLLNVRQICAGSVGKVGALYTVSVRLIDVQTGAVSKSVTEDLQGPVEQLLTTTMRSVAFKLAGKTPDVGLRGDPGRGAGDIFIKSNPSDAEIYLDGFNTGEKTPATLRGISIGSHDIMVIKGNQIAETNIQVKANDIVYTDLNLQRGSGSLRVYSNPPEAEVFIDGQLRGKTPLVIRDISVGEQAIELKKEGYENIQERVNVMFNKPTNVDVQLKRLAQINIESSPSEAAITIDNKFYGNTPAIVTNIPSGRRKLILRKKGYADYSKEITADPEQKINVTATLKKLARLIIKSETPHADIYINDTMKGVSSVDLEVNPDEEIRIRISKSNYADWERTISLKEGSTETLNARLEPLTGTLKIKGYPAGSTITLNKKNYNLNKDEINLPVGNYAIDVNHPAYHKKKFNLKIEAGRTKEINATLAMKTKIAAVSRSFFIPGWGQKFQEKGSRSLLYSLAFLGSAGGSYYYTYNYNKAVDDYNNIREQYLAAFDQTAINTLRQEMDKAYDDIKPNEDIRNIFYAAAGAIWLINVVDAMILPPRWEKRVRLSAASNAGNLLTGVEIKF